MRLCNDCIRKLVQNLNSETREILEEKIFPLLEERETVSGKELAKSIGLDRTGVKQVIEELKSSLLLDYFYRGRKRIYKLTETADQYRKLQEKKEKESDNLKEKVEEKEVEEASKEESGSDEELEEKKEVSEDEKEDKEKDNSKTKTNREEEPEKETAEEKKNSDSERKLNRNSGQDTEQLVWNI